MGLGIIPKASCFQTLALARGHGRPGRDVRRKTGEPEFGGCGTKMAPRQTPVLPDFQRSICNGPLVALPSSPPGKAANPERHAAVGSGRWPLPLHREEPRRSTPAATEPVIPHEAGPQDRLHETYSSRRRRRRAAGQSINPAKPRAARTVDGSGTAVMVKPPEGTTSQL
jgi:hypothetical protein